MSSFYGWKLLAGLSAIYFLAIGLTFSGVGVVLPPMVEAFGWTRGQVGFGFALIAMVYGISGPMVARIIGRFGNRMTIVFGGFINATGAVLTCYTSSLWQFYLGAGVLMGIGMAMQTVIPGNQLIANWFHYRRSFALGIFLSVGGLGSLCAIPASMYIAATGQWQHIWLAMACCTLLASCVAFLVVKERPAVLGQEVDGGAQVLPTKSLSKSKVFRTKSSWPVREVVRNRHFWLIVAGGSAAVMGASTVASQLVLHLKDVGIDPVLAGSALGMQGAIGAGARLLSGILGDKIEPRRILLAGLLGQFLAYYFLLNTTSNLQVYLFAISFGLGYGLAAVASTNLIVNFFGVDNNAHLMGIRGIVVTLVGGMGPVGAGMLADHYGNYTVAFSIYLLINFLAMCAVFFVKVPSLSSASKTA